MILNLTQHNATADQINAGINDLPVDFQNTLKRSTYIPNPIHS